MTPEEQELLDALNRQTFAIWAVGIAIVVAVLAVLVVWWIEYRSGDLWCGTRNEMEESDAQTSHR